MKKFSLGSASVPHSDLRQQLEARYWYDGNQLGTVTPAGRKAGPKPNTEMLAMSQPSVKDRPYTPPFIHPNQAKVL